MGTVADDTHARLYQAREDVLYRKLVDGGLVYDSVSTKVHHLNASASLVWESCQQGSSLATIVVQVRARYDVAQEDAESDVTAILRRFARSELLEGE